MHDLILSAPIAFLIYIVLVTLLSGFGRILAGPAHTTPVKSSTYASGEESPAHVAVPGYRPYFVVSLFFAILHLGVLMLGSSYMSLVSLIYLGGLIFVLLSLILG